MAELGYQAVVVNSGEAAIAYAREHKVDLVLLDMMMEPGIDGCETFAEIINIHPEQKAIIVSGYAQHEQVERTLDFGAASFLKKPYTMEQLGMAVRAVLQGEDVLNGSPSSDLRPPSPSWRRVELCRIGQK